MEVCAHTLKCAVDIMSKLMKISLLKYLYIKAQTEPGFGWFWLECFTVVD